MDIHTDVHRNRTTAAGVRVRGGMGSTTKPVRPPARAMLIEAFLIDTIQTIENDVLAGLLRPVAEAWLADGEAA